MCVTYNLLFFLIVSTLFPLGSSGSTLALDTTRTASTVRRGKSEIDVFLRVKTDDKGWNVDNLFSNTI